MFTLFSSLFKIDDSIIDWVKFCFDAILTLIAIIGVFFSAKTLKKSDRSYLLTLKEIEKSDIRYRMNYMPIIKFVIEDTLVVEGINFMSGEEINFNISSLLKNVGLGPALNIRLKVEHFYEDKKNKFRDNGKKAGFDIEGAYSLPILKYEKGKWIKGLSCSYFDEEIEDLYVSLIGQNEFYNLPEEYLSGLLNRTAIDFFYASLPRGHNKLIYHIVIQYESIFGDKITSEQIIERTYIVKNKGGKNKEIDGILYDNTDIEIFFIEHDFAIESELMSK